MDTRWTLHVEDFGKIKEADLRIAPFVGLVGENNSGKSYLMTLLWGIMTRTNRTLNLNEYYLDAEYELRDYIEKHRGKDVLLEKEMEDCLVRLYNDFIKEQIKAGWLQRLFNYPVDAGLIEIRDVVSKCNLYFTYPDEAITPDGSMLSWDKSVDEAGSSSSIHIYIPDQRVNILTLLSMAELYLFSDLTYTSVFLPASRTGFMLTYPQLVSQSLSATYSMSRGNEYKGELTSPIIDFLQFLTEYQEMDEKETDPECERLASFVEKELVSGKIISSGSKMPILKYQEEGMQQPIPMHMSSSVITEVTPFLMILKNKQKKEMLFLEEPEAHLHPELQKKMAQLLIRMSNAGRMVVATTHSDTILQHINNMLMLKASKERSELMERFGYEEEDLLDREDICLYQFDHTEDGRSVLKTLENTAYGFVVPTFNDSLVALLEETYAFQED